MVFFFLVDFLLFLLILFWVLDIFFFLNLWNVLFLFLFWNVWLLVRDRLFVLDFKFFGKGGSFFFFGVFVNILNLLEFIVFNGFRNVVFDWGGWVTCRRLDDFRIFWIGLSFILGNFYILCRTFFLWELLVFLLCVDCIFFIIFVRLVRRFGVSIF